jgi:hypothetical protein
MQTHTHRHTYEPLGEFQLADLEIDEVTTIYYPWACRLVKKVDASILEFHGWKKQLCW